MSKEFQLTPGHCFVIGEIGINHQGSLDIAKQLIDVAVDAGCDAVKFQKRTPLLSLPPEMWDVVRDTPWGVRMTYREYREKIELSWGDYQKIADYCGDKILWFASPWDFQAANGLSVMDCPVYKIPSAKVVTTELIDQIASFNKPVIMSTGMSDDAMVRDAVKRLYGKVPSLSLLACTAKYPAPIESLNLSRMNTLRREFTGCHVGYSGHEVGLWTTLCAVAMGAEIVERHITLDRSMPGSDHAASIEPQGLKRLIKEIRNFEAAYGTDGLRILECEQGDIKRLRG